MRAVAGHNPYVGPRPFQIAETLYGREREITELDHLLSAERIVLLYSPSGAGKSSLINAGLIPRLDWYWALTRGQPTAGRFDCWPPTRVNHPLPTDFKVKNRFAWSAAMGLEQEVPDAFRRSPQALAGLTLKDAVAGRRRRSGAPAAVLLIFDQFEELLRVDPLGIPEKEAFFDQLGELLYDPQIWALFVLREDYLAAIDPYCRRLPTRLTHRYRIDRLSREAAAEAMEGPTRDTARKFAPGVVAQLVQDLAQVQVQQPDGTFVTQTGLHVEPMHLQVVCVGLWDRMAPDDLLIDVDDVTTFGDVGRALANYYESSVAGVAAGDPAEERRIRDWFEDRLITPDGVRRQVLLGVEQSEGLRNAQIERLQDTYLVRAEQRARATWFELAHDRLIQPIRNSNADWRTTHLSDLQRRAILWDRGERPDGLLLPAEALEEALHWSAEHARDLTEVERDFIERSQEVHAGDLKARRQARWIRRLAIWATVGCCLALAFLVYALVEHARTEQHAEQARRSLFNAQLARGREVLQRNPAAAQRWLEDEERLPHDLQSAFPIWSSLHTLAEDSNPDRALPPRDAHPDGVYAIAITPDGEHLASVGADGAIAFWAVHADTPPRRLPGNRQQVNALACAPDAPILVSITADGSIERWNWLTGEVSRPLKGPAETDGKGGYVGLNAVAFTPDGQILATAGDDGSIALASAVSGEPRARLTGHRGPVRALAVSPDGLVLASVGDDAALKLWDIGSGRLLATLTGHTTPIEDVAFSPDGTLLATAGGDGTVRLWNRTTATARTTLAGHSGEVGAVAFSPDGGTLVSGDSNGTVILWDIASGEIRTVLRGHRDAISGLAFDADGSTLFTASADGTLRPWKLARRQDRAASLIGHTGPVYGVAFAPGGELLASASWDGTVRLWDVATGQPRGAPLAGDRAALYGLAFSPDGGSLAAAGQDGSVTLFDLTDPAQPPARIAAHQGPVVRLAFDPDGNTLASAGIDGQIKLWHGPDRRLRLSWQASAGDRPEQISGIAFRPHARMLASTSWDGTLRLWDTDKGTPLRSFDADAGRLEGVAFSPDGKIVAAAAWDGGISLWDPDTGRERPRLLGHTDRVIGLAFAPDGQTLASASEDGTAKVWDLTTGKAAKTLAEHTDWVVDVAYSPDSAVLATASWDRIVKLWHAKGEAPYRFTAPAVAPGVGFRLEVHHLVDVGVRRGLAEQFIDRLNETMARFHIDTQLRRAHFLAMVLHESASLKVVEERLNYSAESLMRVFPRAFQSKAEAERFAQSPERIANRVYADRLGNGNEASGDGWRFRGRGLVLFVGRDNYRALGQAVGADLMTNPDLVATRYAADTAGFFWESKNLNALADKDDLTGIVRRVNGGLQGLDARKALAEKLKKALGEF